MSWLTSRNRSFGVLTVLVGAALLGLAGCETTGDLTVDLPGIETAPPTYLDLPVSTSTVLLNPALTLKSDHYLVGRLRDEVTGVTEARGVLNLRPSARLDSLPGRLLNSKLESVVLLAPFEQVYGTASAPLRFDIFPLTQRLDERVIYTAASKPLVGTNPIATGLSASLNATRQVDQTAADKSGTVITIASPDQVVAQVLQKDKTTPNELFTRIFNKLNSVTFAQADLDGVLAGIVLAPSAGYEGSIVSFGRGRVAAQLKFSFTYDSVQTAPLPNVSRRRSYSLFFGPGPTSTGSAAAEDARFYTQLTNDNSNSLLAALTDKSKALSAAALSDRSYLQAGLGLGTRIAFTDLTQLQTLRNIPGVAINRAELRVPVQPYTSGVFPYPTTFYALEVDAGNNILTRTVNGVSTERIVQRDGANQQGTGNDASAAFLNSGSTGPYYTYLMTDYLQAYLTTNALGTDVPLPAALVLSPTLRSTPSLTLNRAVIDATNIRLRVYYSQLR
jgi:hypothetical protein